MKKVNILLAVVFLALCGLGWVTAVTGLVSHKSQYASLVEEADQWVERGLYQRAISNYQEALQEKSSEELYCKIQTAYELRYQEAPKDTLDDYMDFLQSAVDAYPTSEVLVDRYVEIYMEQEEYTDVYQCLRRAVDGGYDTETVQKLLLQSKYAYTMAHSGFSGVIQCQNSMYVVGRNQKWSLYSLDGGYALEEEYDYVSPCNEDGEFVVTGTDSRIVNLDGMVLGVFPGTVTWAGLMSDGLIPAQCDGTYSYYNDLGEKQFGDYEMAGTFQNERAAVQTKDGWMLVDAQGESQSGLYEEIVLDELGRYLWEDRYIAKENGTYGIYDKKMKLECTLDYQAVDICTQDGIIAVKQDGKWGYVNTKGEMVIQPQFQQARSFSNGLGAVCQDGKWGFINLDGQVVIECQFADVGYMDASGICPVQAYLEPEETAQPQPEASPEPEASAQPEVSSEPVASAQPEASPEPEASAQPESPQEPAGEQGEEHQQSWSLLKLENGILEE